MALNSFTNNNFGSDYTEREALSFRKIAEVEWPGRRKLTSNKLISLLNV
jgi:hypothetical protein